MSLDIEGVKAVFWRVVQGVIDVATDGLCDFTIKFLACGEEVGLGLRY